MMADHEMESDLPKSPQVIVNHSSNIVPSVLKSLLEDETLADFTFVVNGVRIRAHKIILGANCEYFKTMFYGALNTFESLTNEVNLVNVSSPNIIKAILRYIYTGELDKENLTFEQLLELLQLANQYQLFNLTKAMAEVLI